MKLSLVSCAVLAVTLPALADNAYLTQDVLDELTAIDPPPTAPSAAGLVSPAITQASLSAIAMDLTVDTGVRIRAIRALADHCPAPCGAGTVHDTLLQLIARYQAQPAGQEVVLLRAALESLGAAGAVQTADLPAVLPLLAHPSRDVRATVARTLQTICTPLAAVSSRQVLTAVIAAQRDEPTAQVLGELSTTEEVLDNCKP